MILSGPKVLAACGLGVGSCLSIPLLVAKNKSLSPFDLRQISIKGPLLECNEGTRNLKVYLVFNNEWAGEKDSDDITLKIVDIDVIQGGAVARESVVWGPEVNSGREKISWDLQFLGEGRVMMTVPERNSKGLNPRQSVVQCTKSGIVLKSQELRRDDFSVWKVTNGRQTKRIYFDIPDEQCLRNSKGKECSITFKEANNLTWSPDFQPKAHFLNGYERKTKIV